MNPTAKIIQSTYSTVPLKSVLGTGLFSLSSAELHENWLKEARFGEHVPETEEYGISSITYRAFKPFDPIKLDKALQSMLDKDSAPFQESIILRAKGFCWLSNRPDFKGQLSLAGHQYHMYPSDPWWATIDKSSWPDGLEQAITPLWREPYGDRQQEIVVIGQLADKEAVKAALDGCLISDELFADGPDAWFKAFPLETDPFRDSWVMEEEQDVHHHGEECNHEGECHHDHSHHSHRI